MEQQEPLAMVAQVAPSTAIRQRRAEVQVPERRAPMRCNSMAQAAAVVVTSRRSMLAPEVERRSKVGIAGEPNRPPMTAQAAAAAAATSERGATAATATSGPLEPQADVRPVAEARAVATSMEG